MSGIPFWKIVILSGEIMQHSSILFAIDKESALLCAEPRFGLENWGFFLLTILIDQADRKYGSPSILRSKIIAPSWMLGFIAKASANVRLNVESNGAPTSGRGTRGMARQSSPDT